MSESAAIEPTLVECLHCWKQFEWSTEEQVYIYDESDGKYHKVDLGDADKLTKLEFLGKGYQPCPHVPGGASGSPHYLPARYRSYTNPPIVIGLVGSHSAGKSHLLTAMISQLTDYEGLAPLGLRVAPLDALRYSEFRKTNISPFEKGKQLAGTNGGITEYSEALVVERLDGTGAWPVTSFDVAGEDFLEDAKIGQSAFLPRATAFLFVHGLDDGAAESDYRAAPNRAFSHSLKRLSPVEDVHKRPSAIAITKSDRLRYTPPVDRWWRGQSELEDFGTERIARESRDAYAFLYARSARTSLTPFDMFDRCTLHFVSASGVEADTSKRTFPRGTRPRRVLEPLAAILAMAGVVPDVSCREMGLR
jgi:hypothetical protein